MEKNTTTSNMKKTITIIALLITLGVSAQTEISNYKPGVDKEGVTYYLPKTLVKIKVNGKLIQERNEKPIYLELKPKEF